MSPNKNHLICQFKVTLKDIQPPIWRRIQVPDKYSFWDLHVAIQDSMGWLDYHLHVFQIHGLRRSKVVEIGIPDDEIDEDVILPGWNIPIRDYFREPGNTALYLYDFGDGWQHEVVLEGILLKEEGIKYPRCIAGKRACPPEDCGSIPGYYDLLNVIKNPKHDEYDEMIAWLKGHAKNYYPYDPDRFNPEQVHFDNPKKRWKYAFSKS
ncbi:MAG: plasmid pRiA4b ORF-3 family protein [Deltaproteobacteria bacterium]|nr:plasmid pRiA4b ORF-3 family protein [Deltaproteobacteria bacterium]MBM4322234.1 plasmid pRiA4b ORF-3 family protein [Deltaproteobacteria bacterium]MBM4348172.1 plasmid pRiA4b ORF-3 family protein [Deltaproteobacteria bacterium]